MFSERTPGDFRPNPLSTLAEQKRREGAPLTDLTVSNPTRVNLDYPAAELMQALAAAELFPYEPSPRGLPSAREAAARLLSGKADPEQLWLTSGTSDAYAYLIKLLAGPGDEFIVPSPGYPLFDHLLQLEGARAVHSPIRYAGGWFIDIDALMEKAGPRTRAIVLVNPNNPTGHYVKRSEAARLLSFCADRKIALITDEVFFEFTFSPEQERVSLADLSADTLTFTLGGFSKLFGLPQLKLSWIYAQGPAPLLRAAGEKLDWISDLYLSVGTPVQRALPRLIEAAGPMTERIRERVRINHRFLSGAPLRRHGVTYLAGEGGWSAVLQLPAGADEEALALNLLQCENTLVHPGYFFDLPCDAAFVVSLLADPAVFEKGTRALLSKV